MKSALRGFDLFLIWLLALGGVGHGFVGTLLSSPLTEPITLWSFSGSLAVWLVAALHWMRRRHPGDRVIAWFAAIGAVSWALLMVWLMAIADMWADPRPWGFILVCLLLACFSAGPLTRQAAWEGVK